MDGQPKPEGIRLLSFGLTALMAVVANIHEQRAKSCFQKKIHLVEAVGKET
jgi:hypothetical protein